MPSSSKTSSHVAVLLVVLLLSGYCSGAAIRVDRARRVRQLALSASEAHAQANEKALVKAGDSTEEPITLTVIAVTILLGLATNLIYDLAKYAFSTKSWVGKTSHHGPRSISTLGPDEKQYPTSLFPYCTSRGLTFSPGARRRRTWKVFDDKWFWQGPDCKLSLKWEWVTSSARFVDCSNAKSHPDYKGHHPEGAFRKYMTGLSMQFSNSNGNPISTNAYVRMGVGMHRYAFGTNTQKQQVSTQVRMTIFAEIWEEGYCSGHKDEGGTIWRFFYPIRNGHVTYAHPGSPGTSNRFQSTHAYDHNQRLIMGKEIGAGVSGRI